MILTATKDAAHKNISKVERKKMSAHWFIDKIKDLMQSSRVLHFLANFDFKLA